MGHSGFQPEGHAVAVHVGQNAFRKLAEISAGGSAALDAHEALAITEELDKNVNWLPAHKGGLFLTHNEHRTYHETVEQWLEDSEGRFEWVTPDEHKKAIAEDSVWILQWYPDTPVSCLAIGASSLEAIKDYLSSEDA